MKSEFSEYNYKATEQKDQRIQLLQTEIEQTQDQQVSIR